MAHGQAGAGTEKGSDLWKVTQLVCVRTGTQQSGPRFPDLNRYSIPVEHLA